MITEHTFHPTFPDMEPTRYRSTGHRPKTPQSQAEDVVFSAASSPSLTSVTPPVNVSRSPSRYRRRGAATTSASTSDLSTHPVPDIPPDLKASQASMMPGLRQQFREHPRARGRIAETPHQRPRTGSERSLSGEKSRTVVASKSWPLQHDDTKTRHVSNEKGVRGDITSVSPAERDSLARRFGRLRKRRNDETTLPRPKTGTEEPTRTASSESRSSEEGLYSFIKAGGGGAVPGTDAPKSAVNAGNRVCQPALFRWLSQPGMTNRDLNSKVCCRGMRAGIGEPSCNPFDDCIRSYQGCVELPV